MSQVPKMHPSINSFVVTVIFIIIFTFLIRKFSTVPYRLDEVSWFFHTQFFDELILKRNLDSDMWNSYESFDHPQVSKYIFGAYLYVRRPDFSVKRDALMNKWGRWQFYSSVKDSDLVKSEFTPYILAMREINLVTTMVALIGLFFVALIFTSNIFISLSLPILLVNNQLFLATMLRATNNAHYFTFTIWAFLAALLFTREQKRIFLLLLAILVALATGSKLIGSIVLVAWGYFTLFKYLTTLKREWLTYFLVVFALALFFWLIINPALYKKPLENTLKYFTFRTEQSAILQHFFPDTALILTSSKVRAIYCRLISPECGKYYTRDSRGHLSQSLIINLILLSLGCLQLIRKFVKENASKDSAIFFIVLIYALVTVGGIYLPLDADQYYLPLLVVIVLLQVLGLHLIFDGIRRRLSSNLGSLY